MILPDGTRIRLSEAYGRQPAEIMSMWSDGTVRPHRVAADRPYRSQAGVPGAMQERPADPGHRRASSADDGRIRPVADMKVGDTELIALPMISEKQREARRQTMTRLAHSAERPTGTASPRSG